MDCCRSTFARLSRAAAGATRDRLRRMGLLGEEVNWQQRAETCERCPMRRVVRGVTYCGQPFLSLPVRDETTDGCGCPVRAKARDPREHCPVDRRMAPAAASPGGCTCKWCAG